MKTDEAATRCALVVCVEEGEAWRAEEEPVLSCGSGNAAQVCEETSDDRGPKKKTNSLVVHGPRFEGGNIHQ